MWSGFQCGRMIDDSGNGGLMLREHGYSGQSTSISNQVSSTVVQLPLLGPEILVGGSVRNEIDELG